MNKLQQLGNWITRQFQPKEQSQPTKREAFLRDVLHEVEMLRQNATPEEIARLDLSTFDESSPRRCIYGQMTGSCTTQRAHQLMDVACIRVMDFKSKSGKMNFVEKGIDIEDEDFRVNGEYKGQTWEDCGGRDYKHMSALEGYILTKNANITGIMAYLKGEADTLEL